MKSLVKIIAAAVCIVFCGHIFSSVYPLLPEDWKNAAAARECLEKLKKDSDKGLLDQSFEVRKYGWGNCCQSKAVGGLHDFIKQADILVSMVEPLKMRGSIRGLILSIFAGDKGDNEGAADVQERGADAFVVFSKGEIRAFVAWPQRPPRGGGSGAFVILLTAPQVDAISRQLIAINLLARFGLARVDRITRLDAEATHRVLLPDEYPYLKKFFSQMLGVGEFTCLDVINPTWYEKDGKGRSWVAIPAREGLARGNFSDKTRESLLPPMDAQPAPVPQPASQSTSSGKKPIVLYRWPYYLWKNIAYLSSALTGMLGGCKYGWYGNNHTPSGVNYAFWAATATAITSFSAWAYMHRYCGVSVSPHTPSPKKQL